MKITSKMKHIQLFEGWEQGDLVGAKNPRNSPRVF